MKKKNIFTFILSVAMVCSLFAMPLTKVYAAETKDVHEEITTYADIDSVYLSNVKAGGQIKLEIPSGRTARTLHFVGNKTGGGANTTITLYGTGCGMGKTIPLNGEAQTVTTINVSGPTTLVYTYGINDVNTSYNLVFWITD